MSLPKIEKTGLCRPKRFDESRKEFLNAALQLLSEKGYHTVSVDDIIKRAKRSKGGFYHHFQNKDQVYLELFDNIFQSTGDQINQELKSGKTVREILNLLIDRYEHVMTDSPKLKAAAVFFLLAIHNKEVQTIVGYLRKKSVEMFAAFFQQAIDRGEFNNDFNSLEISDLIFSSSRGIVLMSTIFEEQKNIPKKLRLFVELQLRALEKK